MRVREDRNGWWLDVDGNAPKLVSRGGSVTDISRFAAAHRAVAFLVGVAVVGLLIAVWSLVSAHRARRRARRVTEGLDATHRGGGWIAPDDDRPPVHLPGAVGEDAGPVVLTSAPVPPRSYRDGGAAPPEVAHLAGTRDEAVARALDEERGNLAFAVAAVVFLTLPLVFALVGGIAR